MAITVVVFDMFILYLNLRDFTLGLSLRFQVGVYNLRKGHSRAVVKRDVNVFILHPHEPQSNQ